VEKNLLEKIRDEYVADAELSAAVVCEIEKFCAFAENWLSNSQIVGAGFDESGLSIRLPDGEKLAFFSVTTSESVQAPVAITGVTTSTIGSSLNTVPVSQKTDVPISKSS